MTKLTLLFSLCFAFLLAGFSTSAQQNNIPQVSVELKDVTIDTFVTELESQTGYHFYYDPAQFDSLRISISVTRVSLQRILELVFANSAYRFAIPEQQSYVLLTKGAVITTTLPAGFFSKVTNDTLQKDQAGLPDYGDKKKTRTDASIENKLFEIGIKNNNPGQGTIALAG